jgi:hypothetical protein
MEMRICAFTRCNKLQNSAGDIFVSAINEHKEINRKEYSFKNLTNSKLKYTITLSSVAK